MTAARKRNHRKTCFTCSGVRSNNFPAMVNDTLGKDDKELQSTRDSPLGLGRRSHSCNTRDKSDTMLVGMIDLTSSHTLPISELKVQLHHTENFSGAYNRTSRRVNVRAGTTSSCHKNYSNTERTHKPRKIWAEVWEPSSSPHSDIGEYSLLSCCFSVVSVPILQPAHRPHTPMDYPPFQTHLRFPPQHLWYLLALSFI